MGNTVVAAIAASFIAIAFVGDVRSMTISNRLNGSFFALAILLRFIAEGWAGGAYALTGAAAGFIPLLALYALKGIGAGDVKFFAALGALIGAAAILQVFMYAVLFGGFIGVLLLVARRSFGKRMLFGAISLLVADTRLQARESSFAGERSVRFPFMIAVVPGSIAAWFMAPL